jgi:methyltransferase
VTLNLLVLALVTLLRLVELPIARANTGRLLAIGGQEVAASHYRLIVALHAAFLASLWLFALDQPINVPLLILFGSVECVRIWVLLTLGQRWTTRIIVVPGETLVSRGPYKYLRHPNYAVVVAEIALLPLVFGLWRIALVFSVANAALLSIRIREENRALGR